MTPRLPNLALLLCTFVVHGCHCVPDAYTGDTQHGTTDTIDSGPAHTGDTAPVHTGDTDPAHTGDSTVDTQGDTATGVPGPDIPHDLPSDGAMCFDCNLCGGDEEGVLELTHYVCIDCHVGPDGSVPEELQDSCGCDTLDCDAVPPVLGCGDCHTDGSNDLPSAQDMNDRCMGGCHLPAGNPQEAGLPQLGLR